MRNLVPSKLAAVSSLVVVALASTAHADTVPEDRAAADALFKEGRALVKQGRHAEACPKLAASQRLDPAIGTLLALGDCYELRGQTASAWGTFNEAAAGARKAGDTRRAEEAVRRAGLLEPKLAKLTVEVAHQSRGAGLVVKRNGKPIDDAVLGAAVPVDPGEHVVEASAPQKKPWRGTVQVSPDAGVTVISIPPLVPADVVVAVEPPPFRADAAASGWSTQRTVGLVVGGVGVVGVALGAVFGAITLSKVGKIEDQKVCSNADPPVCTQAGLTMQRDANTSANVSNTAFAIGGAAVIAGVVAFATAPGSKGKTSAFRAEPVVAPGTAGISLRGAF